MLRNLSKDFCKTIKNTMTIKIIKKIVKNGFIRSRYRNSYSLRTLLSFIF